MVEIFTGSGLGLERSSATILGNAGTLGNAATGTADAGVSVNATTGNLVIQAGGETLSGVGDSVELDAAVGQTYNSLGLLNAANNTTWEAQGAQILNPTGTLNTAGSTVQRLGWDGSLVTYTWQANYVNTDTTTGAYVVKEGAGPYDSITNVSGSWFWHDGSTGVTEAYAHTNNVVSSRYDLNGNTLNYTYNAANQITRMTTSDGEYINLTYSGANLVQLTTYGSGGATLLTRTSYGYDSANRLTSTTVDLTPADNSTADGNVYTTTYTYVVPASQVSSNPATANLIASVKQTDGSEVDFTYDSSNRVSSITQWVNSTTSRTTTFTYGSVTTTSGSTAISYAGGALYAGEVISGTGIPAGTTIASVNATSSTGGTAVLSAAATASGTIAVDTTVTDPQGNKTVLTYDAKGELLSVASPAAQNGTSEFRSYTYDSNGNVLTESVYANVGNAPSGSPISQLTNTYDPNGNLASTIDLAGDETSYTYNQFNEALTKTVYTVPKQGSTAASGAETTFYVYDAHGRLNFTVSQAGDVTYNVVNTLGQTTSTLNYTAVLYSTAGLTASTPIALATMTTWQAGLTSAQKAAVERTDYTYDARGNLTTATTYSATDANGNGLTTSPYTKTTYVYDQAGELISKLLNDGSSAQAYVYDGLGRITLQTDAAGKSTQNTYNNAANTKTVTYANGLVDTLSYDKAGELVSSVNTGSGIATTAISYIYDSIGNLRVSTDPAGINTYYFYDADGRKTGQVDGAGFLTEYKYDAANRLTATVTYTATLSATQLTSLAPTSGVPSAVSLTAIQPLASPTDDWNWTVYNAAGQVSQTINAVGSVAAYTYDGTGAVTQTTQYANELTSAQLATLIENTPGQNVLANPGFNGTTGWSDWSGTLTTGTQNSLNYIQGTMTSTAQYQSNEVANVFAVTAGQQLNIQAGVGAAGVVGYVELAVTWRDVNGNIITVGGNQIQVVGAARNGAQAYNTQISGSVTAPTGAVSATFGIYFSASGAGSSTFQLIEPTVTIANATLSPVTVTPNSASDRTTRNFYNADGLLIGSLDARGYLTQIDYDDAGQKVDTVAYANLVSPSLLVSGTFSQLQASVGSSSRDQHSYVIYDGRGLVAATIDPMGNLTRYTYTARGEVATKVTGQQVTANTVYTLATLPVATGAVETTAYTYDGDGRVLTQTLGQGTSQQTATTYTYDAVGNVLTVTNGNAYTTTSTYDALGRVLQISQAIDSTSADNIVTKYTYDARGNRTSVTDGRGNTTYSYYDGDDRLVLSVDADGFATRTAYYATGQVASVTHYATAVSGTYNATTQPTTSASSNDATTKFTYDAAGRLTATTDAAGYAESYGLDAFGDRTQVTNKIGGVTTYTYDAKGNLLTETMAWATGTASTLANGTAESATVTNAYGYDAFSNRILQVEAQGLAEARTTTYVYDNLNRLTSQSVSLGAQGYASTLYQYDGNGNVVQSTDPNSNKTYSYYDALNRKTAQINALGVLTTYAYDNDSNLSTETVYATPLTLVAGTTPTPTPPSGGSRTTIYSYDSANRLIGTTVLGVTTGGWNGSTYVINPAVGVIPGVADPNGSLVTRQTVYDAAGNVIESIDGNGNKTYNYYDANGNKIAQVDPDSYLTTYSYDANGNVTQEYAYANKVNTQSGSTVTLGTSTAVAALVGSSGTSSLDRITQFTYDKNGNRLTETRLNVAAATAAGTSDAIASAPTTLTTTNGATSVSFTGTPLYLNQVISGPGVAAGTIVASVNTASGTAILSTAATASGMFNVNTSSETVLTTTSGSTTVNFIGGVPSVGQSVSGTGIASGTTITAVNAAAGTATLSAAATASSSIVIFSTSLLTAVSGSTTVSYSGIAPYVGEVISGIGIAAGTTITSVNTAAGTATLSVAATASGSINLNPQAETTLAITSGLTTATYTGLPLSVGQPVTGVGIPAGTTVVAVNPSTGSATLSAAATATGSTIVLANSTITYTYNALGEVISKREATGDTTAYVYDSQGRLTTTTTATGQVTNEGYDGLNDVTRSVSSGAKSAPRTTTYTYGPGGRLASMTGAGINAPAGAGVTGPQLTTWYTYDLAGNLIQQSQVRNAVDFAGAVADIQTIYQYDALNRQISQQSSYLSEVTQGSATGATWVAGDTDGVIYNAYGAVAATTVNGTRTTQFVYDNAGHLIASNSGDGTWKAYVTDANGNATLTIQSLGATDLSTLISSGMSGGLDISAFSQANQAIALQLATNNGANAAFAAQGISVTTTTGSTTISYSGGALYAGEAISGAGIPAGTTIVSVNAAAGSATLSAAATASGTFAPGASVTTVNGSTAISYSGGALYVGEAISGTGIPAGAKIASVNASAGTATLSVAATASGTITVGAPVGTSLTTTSGSATVSYVGSLWVGEPISGVGIPAGATVASINAAAGTAALSVPATASGTIVVGVEETIGIFDSRNQQVQTIQTQRQIDATGDLYAITTSQAYNAFGDMVSQTDARGNATTYQYNTLDKLTAQISPQVAIASGNGSTSAGNPITYNYYDISGRLIATRDADGNLTTQVLQAGTGYGGAKALAAAVYHPDGGIVQATYDVYGDALTQTDAVGNVTSNIYDNSGNLIEVDHPVATLNTTNGSANVTFSGGALQVGEPITAAGIPAGAVVVSVSGNTATLSAAATATGTVQVAGQLINSYSYDGLGEQVSQSNNLMTPGTLTGQPATFGQNGSGGAETFTVTLPTNPNMKSGSIVVSATNLASGVTLTGSVSGGVLTLNYSDTASGGNGGGNANFTLTQNGNILYQGTVSGIYFAKNDYYNISGQVQAVYAASGVQTTAYDAQGRVISTTDYMGYTVNYAYQWNGALATNGLGTYGGWTKTTTDVDAGETSSDTTDAFGHEITKTDLGGQIYSFTYNKAGELVAQSTSNPLNAIQILGVNASLTAGQKVYSQNSQFYLTYQTDGNLVVYGPGGAVLWASGTSGNAPRDAIMQDDGNLVVYNSSGSPNWASGTVNNSGATLFLTNNGQLEIISATKSLVWSTPAYSTPVGGTGGENLKYAYYNTGKIASITDNSNAITGYYGTTLNSKFTYDQNGNRLNTNYTSTNVSYAIYGINYGVTTTVLENATATYDALNRVTSVTDPGTSSRPSYTQTKTYDANGNIIENKTVHQNIGTTQALTAATTDDYWYAYDAMNRVVISEGDLSGAAGAAGTQVAIDIAGSMGGANILARTGQTAGTAIAYNADGQEISSTTKTSQSVFHNVRYSKYDTQSVLVGTYAQEIEQLYAYNAQGYLVSTSVAENSATINGTGASATLTVNALGTPAIQSTETRDALGRVLTQNEYDTAVEANSNMFGTPSATGAPGTIIYSETYAYNNDSQIVSSQVSDIQDSATSGVTNTVTTTYYNYGSVVAGGSANATSYADGNVISQTQNSTTYTGATGTASPSSTTVVTNNVYLWLDSAQLASITATYSGAQSGTTASTFDYDRNGHVSEVVTTGTNAHTNTYTESAAGLIMENNEISSSNGSSAPETFYFYLDDQQIGQIGNNGTTNVNYTTSINNQTNVSGGSGAFSGGASAGTSTANFDANYNAINATGNGSAPAGSSYTVQSGQTLQSIAASVYGDSNLWYVIADANGLSGSSNLTAGTVLTLPNTVENAGNTASTFKPYNANAALGDVQPGAPIPPAQSGGGGCGGIGEILMAVVAIAVAVVVATVPGVGEALDGSFGGMLFGEGGLLGEAGTDIAVGAIAGVAGNVASQGVGLAIGEQSSFNWGSLGMAAISGAVGGAVSTSGIFDSIPSSVIGDGLTAVTSNIISQGVGVATGLQQKFDWAGVAASAAGAGVQNGLAGTSFGASLGQLGNQIVSGTAGAIVNAATRSALTGTDFGSNVLAALPQVIGNTIGNAVAGGISGSQDTSAQGQQTPQAGGITALQDPGPIKLTQTDLSALDNLNLQVVPPTDTGLSGGAGAVGSATVVPAVGGQGPSYTYVPTGAVVLDANGVGTVGTIAPDGTNPGAITLRDAGLANQSVYGTDVYTDGQLSGRYYGTTLNGSDLGFVPGISTSQLTSSGLGFSWAPGIATSVSSTDTPDLASQVSTAAGGGSAAAGIHDLTLGFAYTLGTNLKMYASGWGGNQYVSTYRLGNAIHYGGVALAGVSFLSDTYSYANGNLTTAHYATNTAINAIGVFGGPVGAGIAIGYYGISYGLDTYYKGGSDAAFRDAQNYIANHI